MSDLLADYVRKRRRAKHHADVLRQLVEGFSNLERQPVKGELQLHSGKHTFDVQLERIDPEIGVTLGDFVYNARASLDYLIASLVRSTGNEEHGTSQFPIYTPDRIGWNDPGQWWEDSTDVDGKLKNTPAGTKAALKTLQPFYGIPRCDPFSHPLAALAALSNRDKHRRLNLLAHRASVDFVDGDGKPVFQFGTPIPTLISERDERDTYVVSLGLPPEKANMDVYLLASYEVTLNEPPEVIGELVEVVTGIEQFIDSRVLPTVRTLL